MICIVIIGDLFAVNEFIRVTTFFFFKVAVSVFFFPIRAFFL